MIGLHQRESHSCGARHDSVAVLLEQVGVGLVPLRPLPADGLEEHRAELLLRVVHRREPLLAVGLVLLRGVDDAVGLDERLGGAQSGVLAPHLVRVEARDVAVVDVDLRVTLRHPLGDRAADARTLLDPDRGCGPQPLDQALAEDRAAVAGQRQQAVDRVADLRAVGAEQLGHQLQRLLELGVEVVLRERHLGRATAWTARSRGSPRARAGSRGGRRSRPPCRRRAGARSRRCPCRARSGT